MYEALKNWTFVDYCTVYCKICQEKKIRVYCIKCEKCKGLKPDWKVRDGFDEAGLMLIGFCSVFLILIYKNIDFRFLIKSVSKLSFFGAVEFSLEKLEEEIQALEKGKFKHLSYEEKINNINLQKKLAARSTTLHEELSLLSIEIERNLKELYEISLLHKNDIPVSSQEIVDKLCYEKLLDEDVANVIKHFLEVKYLDAVKRNGKNTVSLIELGRRICAILNHHVQNTFNKARKFWGKIRDIKLDRTRIEDVSEDKVVLFTTVSILDSNNNYFPVDNLTKDNFSIFEKTDGVESKAKIIKIEPIEESSTPINISVLLDCSESMQEDNKLEFSKRAIISLLNGLSTYSNLQCGVAVYFVSSENLGWVEGKFFNSNEFDDLISIINNSKPAGSTPLWQGINDVIDNCQKNKHIGGYQIIICLTDGMDSAQTEFTYQDIEAKLLEINIPFVFMGYGNENYSDLIFLSKISGAGDLGIGYFVKVNPDDIEHIFEKIARSITKSYKIYWRPIEIETEGKVEVRIKVKYKSSYGKVAKEECISYTIK